MNNGDPKLIPGPTHYNATGKPFLTSSISGKPIYQGDAVYSGFHDRRGYAHSIFIDEADVYLTVVDDDGKHCVGQAHIRSIIPIHDWTGK